MQISTILLLACLMVSVASNSIPRKATIHRANIPRILAPGFFGKNMDSELLSNAPTPLSPNLMDSAPQEFLDRVASLEKNADESTIQVATKGIETAFAGPIQAGSIPPDPHLGAGPTRVVIVTNGFIKLTDKSGSTVGSDVTLDTFFGTGAFDPKAFWDAQYERFFIISDRGSKLNDSNIDIAVSKTNEPNTISGSDWDIFTIVIGSTGALGTHWADYPGVGMDNENIYITHNMFTAPGNSFFEAILWVVRKSDLLQSSTLTVTEFPTTCNGNRAFGIKPPVTLGQVATDYSMPGGFNFGAGSFCIYTLSNITHPASATLSGVVKSIPSFGSPPNAPQKNGIYDLATGDSRLQNSVRKGNVIYFTASSVSNSRAAVKWFAYNVVSDSMVDNGVISSTSMYLFYPAITVLDDGTIVIVYAASSSSMFPSIYYSSKSVGGSMTSPILLKAGVNYLNNFGPRYGDYCGICRDPSAPNRVWMVHEYGHSDITEWGTWVASATMDSSVSSSSKMTLAIAFLGIVALLF